MIGEVIEKMLAELEALKKAVNTSAGKDVATPTKNYSFCENGQSKEMYDFEITTTPPSDSAPSSDGSPLSACSSLSCYEFAVVQDNEFREKFEKATFEELSQDLNNVELFQELASNFAPFLLHIRQTVTGIQPVSYDQAVLVSEQVTGMFKPRVYVKGSSNKSRTPDQMTRDLWMSFLGGVYKKFFNPVLPHQSGAATLRLKQRLGAILRVFIFGTKQVLKYKEVGPNQISSIGSVLLPDPRSIVIDLNRKFKNRRDNEFKYLKAQKTRHHVDVPPRVVHSARPALKKGETLDSTDEGRGWRAGRVRVATEVLTANLCPKVRKRLGFDGDITNTMSPSKRLRVDTSEQMPKRSRVESLTSGSPSAQYLFINGAMDVVDENDDGGAMDGADENDDEVEDDEEDRMEESNSEDSESEPEPESENDNRSKRRIRSSQKSSKPTQLRSGVARSQVKSSKPTQMRSGAARSQVKSSKPTQMRSGAARSQVGGGGSGSGGDGGGKRKEDAFCGKKNEFFSAYQQKL